MRQHKPAWWQLYVLVPLMIGLMSVEHLDPLPGVSPGIVDGMIVLLMFGAMFAWVHVNGGLVEYDEMQKDESRGDLKITIYQPTADTAKDEKEPNIWTLSAPFNSALHMPTERLGKQEDEGKWSLN